MHMHITSKRFGRRFKCAYWWHSIQCNQDHREKIRWNTSLYRSNCSSLYLLIQLGLGGQQQLDSLEWDQFLAKLLSTIYLTLASRGRGALTTHSSQTLWSFLNFQFRLVHWPMTSWLNLRTVTKCRNFVTLPMLTIVRDIKHFLRKCRAFIVFSCLFSVRVNKR